MRYFTRKRALALATVLGCMGAFAFAAWLSDGVGGIGGKYDSLQALTVRADIAPGGCTPGNTCDGYARIDNPMTNGPLVIKAVVQSGTANDGGTGDCPVSNVTVNPQAGLSIALPAGNNNAVQVPGLFTIAADAPSACQGTSFTRTVRVSAQTP